MDDRIEAIYEKLLGRKMNNGDTADYMEWLENVIRFRSDYLNLLLENRGTNTGAKPIHEGDTYASRFTCPNCDFPKNDTLTTDMLYCFNCGAKLDWSDFI